jgi:lysophospholipase L1-like esterase
MTVVGAFGDSFTCGEGVGLTISPDSTWAAVLARAFPGGALRSYAVAGARVADVRGCNCRC